MSVPVETFEGRALRAAIEALADCGRSRILPSLTELHGQLERERDEAMGLVTLLERRLLECVEMRL